MTNRELKRDIRRNMTTARQHLAAADRLARSMVLPIGAKLSLSQSLRALRHSYEACRPWWKNA